MDYIINGFLACIGTLAALGILAVAWFIWPYIMIVVLRLFSTKELQAKMIDDLKNDSKWSPFQKQKILQLLHAVRWHENKES
jgi:hypothetical protein